MITESCTADTADTAVEVNDLDAGDAVADDARSMAHDEPEAKRSLRPAAWKTIAVYVLLPAMSLSAAAGSGYLKYQDSSLRTSRTAQVESVQAAKNSTIGLLSYRAESVEQDLNAARALLTGQFQDAYTGLTRDVVIPGAKQRHITAVATVPAVASVSASPNRAVALVFVNQTVTVGNDPPTDTASSIRVTMENVGGRWLVSAFDPI